MPYADRDAVQDVLAPFHGRIRSVVERAWAEWRAYAAWRVESGIEPILYSRTIANMVFDAIARIAIKEFGKDASVHLLIEPQTIKLFFKDGEFALASRKVMTINSVKIIRPKLPWRSRMRTVNCLGFRRRRPRSNLSGSPMILTHAWSMFLSLPATATACYGITKLNPWCPALSSRSRPPRRPRLRRTAR